METINIAGVSCNVDKMASLSYERLFECAINNPKWKGVKGAKDLIDKELRDNGFKPSSKGSKPAKTNNKVKHRANDGGGAFKKRSGNRKTRKE